MVYINTQVKPVEMKKPDQPDIDAATMVIIDKIKLTAITAVK